MIYFRKEIISNNPKFALIAETMEDVPELVKNASSKKKEKAPKEGESKKKRKTFTTSEQIEN